MQKLEYRLWVGKVFPCSISIIRSFCYTRDEHDNIMPGHPELWIRG